MSLEAVLKIGPIFIGPILWFEKNYIILYPHLGLFWYNKAMSNLLLFFIILLGSLFFLTGVSTFACAMGYCAYSYRNNHWAACI